MQDNVKTLAALTQNRLLDLSREMGIQIPKTATKDQQVERLANAHTFRIDVALQNFTRDELRRACQNNGIDDTGRARMELARRLLKNESLDEFSSLSNEPSDAFLAARGLPTVGEIVVCRQRQYLVVRVQESQPDSNDMSLIHLVCLDDDAAGRPLTVAWELEIGTRILRTREHGLGQVDRMDAPEDFAGYLNALRWNCVTATNAQLFQSPFRAGIKLMNHQLTPLLKALSLPRANLFIADDVGLGKTIEAGLVLQELRLRQRIDFSLIVCPASVVLQWRDEMKKRFGLHFEVYDRDFIGRRRKERGFRVNPWSTHTRFIISHSMLARPEHRDPLLNFLGDRVKKSILILDEAHAAAPSTATRYAVDSRFTHVIRDVAPRFENRLFLSATPHNGHSNSFAALLELLDGQRFTRGVPIDSEKQLEPVMVRRLKSDLRDAGISFPKRRVIKWELTHNKGWTFTEVEGQHTRPRPPLEVNDATELQMAELLQTYTELVQPGTQRAKFVFLNLQKRLLSSPEAFYRTLSAHAGRELEKRVVQGSLDPEMYGKSDEESEDEVEGEVVKGSRDLNVDEQASAVRLRLLEVATHARYKPDAKISALIAWIYAELRPSGTWNARKLLIFTEYADTKRYILNHLRNAFLDDEQRILQFHGQMSDEDREEVQNAFNAVQHPVRIMVATDAAREGVNLQGACADLVHYDLPWNPAKLEQRNGRIDRTLQPSPEVRCMYFSLPQRPEDRVLEVVVEKIEVIQRELGSLSTVIMERIGDTLDQGIRRETMAKIQAISTDAATRETTKRELESQRSLVKLQREIDRAGRVLDQSRKTLNFQPEQLRKTLDVALQLVAGPGKTLKPLPDNAFALPELPSSWEQTLDSVRPPRERKEDLWDWRKKPLLPIVFHAPDTLNAPLVHVHLEHPLVQRLLSRFRSQGYAAHDLNRATVLRNPHDSTVRVVAFARLSLFGLGATRLHDQIISVTAPWFEGPEPDHLKAGHSQDDQRILQNMDALLFADTYPEVPTHVQERFSRTAASDYATLWAAIEEEAEAVAYQAQLDLTTRADEESRALKTILENQRVAISKQINQVALPFAQTSSEQEQLRQFQADAAHMESRYRALEREIATEPQQLKELYQVALKRLEPVGIVYLWPTTR